MSNSTDQTMDPRHVLGATNELDVARLRLKDAAAGIPPLYAAVVRDRDAGPAPRRAAERALVEYIGTTIRPALRTLHNLELLAGLPFTTDLNRLFP